LNSSIAFKASAFWHSERPILQKESSKHLQSNQPSQHLQGSLAHPQSQGFAQGSQGQAAKDAPAHSTKANNVHIATNIFFITIFSFSLSTSCFFYYR
jgi:hypothetical protein